MPENAGKWISGKIGGKRMKRESEKKGDEDGTLAMTASTNKGIKTTTTSL